MVTSTHSPSSPPDTPYLSLDIYLSLFSPLTAIVNIYCKSNTICKITACPANAHGRRSEELLVVFH